MNDYKRLLKSLQSALGGSITDVEAIKAIVFAGTLSLFVKVLSLCKIGDCLLFWYIASGRHLRIGNGFCHILCWSSWGALATLLTQKILRLKHSILRGCCQFVFSMSNFWFILHARDSSHAGWCVKGASVSRLGWQWLWIGNNLPRRIVSYHFPIPNGIINSSLLTARERFKAYVLLPAMVPVSIIFGLVICPEEYIFIGLLLGTLIGYTVEFLLSSLQLRGITWGLPGFNLAPKCSISQNCQVNGADVCLRCHYG